MLGWMELILASGSPRRRELLAAEGYEFRIVSPKVEELPPGTHPFRRLCAVNAALKAREVEEAHPGAVVLAADTMVGLDGKVLGKPVDLDEARGMLTMLSGRVHEVCTGVCVRSGDEEEAFFEVTWVQFRDFGEIRILVQTKNLLFGLIQFLTPELDHVLLFLHDRVAAAR